MNSRYLSGYPNRYWLFAFLLPLALILCCAPPVERPTGPAGAYGDAKDMFKRNNFARAIEFTDSLASASPPTSYSQRAEVLRAVIFAGRIKSYKEAAEAYEKGSEVSRDVHFKAEYSRLRHDNFQLGANSALGLAETAHQLSGGGTLPKELTLEAPYPSAEGPIEIKEYLQVRAGGRIESTQEDSAAVDGLNKGIDDALADAVSGDRAKARDALATGSTKLDGVDFGLFLGNELVDGATLFDRKHSHDPEKLKMVCGEADEVVKATQALLKEGPNPDKDKSLKKLQDRIKAILKTG